MPRTIQTSFWGDLAVISPVGPFFLLLYVSFTIVSYRDIVVLLQTVFGKCLDHRVELCAGGNHMVLVIRASQ